MKLEIPINLDSDTSKLTGKISAYLATRGVLDIACLPTAIRIVGAVAKYLEGDWDGVDSRLTPGPYMAIQNNGSGKRK